MDSQLTPYQTLRQRLLRKESFTLELVQQVISKPLNSLHTYLGMASLYYYLIHVVPYSSLDQELCQVFETLPKSMYTTQLYQLLTLKLWRTSSEDLELKKHCKMLKILREWMGYYQQKLSKTQSSIFVNLLSFLESQTSLGVERIVFIQEAFDDLRESVTFHKFWEDQKQGVLVEELESLKEPLSLENGRALVDILLLIVPKTQIEIEGLGYLYNSLVKYVSGVEKYHRFVNRSIMFLLSDSSLLRKYERDLTVVSLLYLENADDTTSLQILNQLVSKTSKAVQFALAFQYQNLLEVLYNKQKLQLVQKIQELPAIRELVLRTIPKTAFNFINSHPNQSISITVNQREEATFYFEITKPKSIIFLQYCLDGDIGVSLNLQGDLWTISNQVYFSETKSKSKSVQILANSCGLHSLNFNNKYSWLTAKNIKFSIRVFKPYQQVNHQFNGLIYRDEYIPWRGYNGLRFDDDQGEFLNIWKSAVGNKSDIIIFEDRWFYNGRVSPLRSFDIPELHRKHLSKCLIVKEEMEQGEQLQKIQEGEQCEYSWIVSRLKEWNSEIKIRYCQYEDI